MSVCGREASCIVSVEGGATWSHMVPQPLWSHRIGGRDLDGKINEVWWWSLWTRRCNVSVSSNSCFKRSPDPPLLWRARTTAKRAINDRLASQQNRFSSPHLELFFSSVSYLREIFLKTVSLAVLCLLFQLHFGCSAGSSSVHLLMLGSVAVHHYHV